MRRFFLVLFLFTLSSSHKLHRRSEDVDPLLKELFSETNDPSPKDRRDEQSAGDGNSTSTSTDHQPALTKDDSAPKGSNDNSTDDAPDKDSNSTDDVPDKGSDSASDSKAAVEPASDSKPVDTDASPAADSPAAATEDSDDEAQNATTPAIQDNESDSKLSSAELGGGDDKKEATSKSSATEDTAKEAEEVPKQDSTDNEKPTTVSSKDESAESQPSEENNDKKEETTSQDKATTEDPSTLRPTTNENGNDTSDASTHHKQNEEDSTPVKYETPDENKDTSGETDPKVKQNQESKESANAVQSPAVTTDALPSEKQQTEAPIGQTASIASQSTGQDTDQGTTQATSATNPNVADNTRSEIAQNSAAPQSSVDNVQQPTSDVNVRTNIPEAPAAASQPSWPAANPAPLVPQRTSLETNEEAEFAKKDSIPSAPRQPGASSFPLQLNKHSPGAELIKKFFIAKHEAKKKKEEDAKEKSLIGDGRFTVSSNNGYYNYASRPAAPLAPVDTLQENGKVGVCVDKFDSCPEFAKNHYCTDYKTLMKVQCRKSCKFCDTDDEDDNDDDTNKPKSGQDDDDDDDDDEIKSSDNKNSSDATVEDKPSNSTDIKKENGDEYVAKDNDDKDDDDDDDDESKTSSDSDNKKDSKDTEKAHNGTKSTEDEEKGEKFFDVDSESPKNGSRTNEDLPPTAEEFEQKDEDEDEKRTGSASDEKKNDDNGGGDDDDDSDEIAKELSEQELFSNQNVKKDTIPSAPSPPSAYPKIDLKDVARYVTLYRSVAKKLFGEALDSAKKEFVAQQSKKSDIPVPIKEELRTSKDMSGSLEGFYSSQGNTKRDNIPMKPNNAEFTPNDETWANKAYQEAENYLRSKVPEFKNYAPPAMFNYPFYINDPNKTEDTNEGETSKKSQIPVPDDPEQKYNKTLQDILKKDHISKVSSDPYEYLRNMIPGSSMKPIASKNGIKYIEDTYSRPIHLNTKSQWLDMVAKKKSGIPKPQPVAQIRATVTKPTNTVPQIQTKPEALAAQVAQYKSKVPQVEAQTASQTPQMQQVPSTEDANFLQSNGDPSTSFESLESRNKVVEPTEAASPLARMVRQTRHKTSSH